MAWLAVGRNTADSDPASFNFDWSSQILELEKSISSYTPPNTERANILRYLGHCYIQLAHQSSNDTDFRKAMSEASSSFRQAGSILQRTDDEISTTMKNRFAGLSHYCEAQLANDDEGILRMLKESHEALSIAAGGSADASSALLLELLMITRDIMYYEPDIASRLAILRLTLSLTTDVERIPSKATDDLSFLTLTEAMFLLHHASTQLPDSKQRRELMIKENALKQLLARSVDCVKDPRSLASAFCVTAYSPLAEPQPFYPFEKLLPTVEATKDRLAIGSLFAAHLRNELQTMSSQTDLSAAKQLLEAIEAETEHAKSYLSSYASARRFYETVGYVYWSLADLLYVFQRLFSPDLLERSKIMDRVIEVSRKVRKNSVPSGVGEENSNLSTYLLRRAQLEQNQRSKAAFLEEAWERAQDYENATRTFYPRFELIDAMHFRPYGQIKRELASLHPAKRVEELKSSEEMFSKATTNVESALNALPLEDPQGWEQYLADTNYELGSVQLELFRDSHDQEKLLASLSSFDKALSFYSKTEDKADNLALARTAQCYWRKAEVEDDLGDYKKAAESFLRAAPYYASLSEKMPSLKQVYSDLCQYMKAWTEVESAKQSHSMDDYKTASEHYTASSEFLRATEKWTEFHASVAVLALMEEAESKSREWKPAEAGRMFREAYDLLSKIAGEILSNANKSFAEEDREQLTKLESVVALRKEYCRARAILEEARVADRSGESRRALEKYREASEQFERLALSPETVREKKNLQQMVHLTKAWSAMIEAERKSKPELYDTAVELFAKVRDEATNDSVAVLAAGNSLFCRALQYASQFVLSREQVPFTKAKSYLDQAAQRYSQEGFEVEAAWAKASGKMLDAYSFISLGQMESDPEKKAKYYVMAEKVIQIAAELYEKAGLSGKKQEVLRISENVKEEKQLLLSLTQLLNDRTITVSTTGFTAPTTFYEKATGVEKFDKASVQLNLFASLNNVSLNETFDLRVEIVNMGSAPAMLVRVEDLFPDTAELSSKPEQFGLVENGLDLKGRRLNPLKSEEFKVSIRAKSKGLLSFEPRVVYLDNQGKYGISGAEPIMVRADGARSTGERRLAAIMFTDIEGYTALTQKDESLALRSLHRHRGLVRPIIARYGGREVKTIGDAFLVEFDSALEATECAVEMHRALERSNERTGDKMVMRIGIHVGDVIHSEGDILGDAVNIASRIEPLAKGGGICISDQVYAQVSNKLPYEMIRLEHQGLKNVSFPIEVYSVEVSRSKPGQKS